MKCFHFLSLSAFLTLTVVAFSQGTSVPSKSPRPKQPSNVVHRDIALPISIGAAAYAYELAHEINDYPKKASEWQRLQDRLSEASDSYSSNYDDPYSQEIEHSLDRFDDMIAHTKGDAKLGDDLRILYSLANKRISESMKNDTAVMKKEIEALKKDTEAKQKEREAKVKNSPEMEAEASAMKVDAASLRGEFLAMKTTSAWRQNYANDPLLNAQVSCFVSIERAASERTYRSAKKCEDTPPVE